MVATDIRSIKGEHKRESSGISRGGRHLPARGPKKEKKKQKKKKKKKKKKKRKKTKKPKREMGMTLPDPVDRKESTTPTLGGERLDGKFKNDTETG